MSEKLTEDQQLGSRIVQLRRERGLSQEDLAELVGVDVTTLSRWERGAQPMRPKNLAKVARALEVSVPALEGRVEPVGADIDRPSERDLRTVDFVAWLAEVSESSFAELYQAIAKNADQLDAESKAVQYEREHRRSRITRSDLSQAVADYYDLPDGDHDLYRVNVAGKDITLSILTKPEWTGLNVDMQGESSRSTFMADTPMVTPTYPSAVVNAAVARLADAEANDRVLMNNPMYRLMSIDPKPDHLDASFALATFADYALRNGLMEMEIIDALVNSSDRRLPHGAFTPVRDALLPSVQAALNLDSHVCTGGPVSLFAAARPKGPGHPADYALLVQVRGKRVMDIPGKLSTIPKGWHQPVGEATSQARFATTILRELEEELLGREDLEQISDESRRTADPLHMERHPPAILPLLYEDDVGFHVRGTGFGLNLLSGTYEVPCVIVIEDEDWWGDWGHLIAGNWETSAIETHSSMDTDGLANLIHDPRWSNEGLFALIEGLRCLTELDQTGRIAAPRIMQT